RVVDRGQAAALTAESTRAHRRCVPLRPGLRLLKAGFIVKSKSKKGSQKSSRKRQPPPAQKNRAATNNLSELVHRVETLERELAEGQLRENATSEILRVIASSPTDIQPVLD